MLEQSGVRWVMSCMSAHMTIYLSAIDQIQRNMLQLLKT